MPFLTSDMGSMFAWGAVGGALPTLSKIAGTYGANFNAPPPHLLGVGIAIALYGVIGAVVSRAIGNPDMKHALFAGIAAPAIVASVLAGVSDSNSLKPTPPQTGGLIVSSAFAETSDLSPGNTRPLTVTLVAQTNYPVSGVVEVAAKTAGRTVPIGTITINGSIATGLIEIPKGPTTLVFTSANGAMTEATVTDQTALAIKIGPRTSAIQDFKWALGSQRALDIGSLAVAAPGSP